MRRWSSLAALAIVLACASSARGETQEEQAAKAFEAATAAFDAGDLARAAEFYARSYELYPAPTSAYWQAQVLAKQGKLVAAAERYRLAAEFELDTRATPAFRQAVADAKEALPALEKRIPVIVITIAAGEEPELYIDDVAVPAPAAGPHRVDPGSHVVRASMRGKRPFEQRVALAESTAIDLQIVFTAEPQPRAGARPSPPPPPDSGREVSDGSGQRIAGGIVTGLGGASLIVWAITGGIYLQKQNVVEDHCQDPEDDGSFVCDGDEGIDAAASGKTLGVVNTVMLFAGLGLVTVGVTVILTAPDGETVAIRTRGTGLYLEGAF